MSMLHISPWLCMFSAPCQYCFHMATCGALSWNWFTVMTNHIYNGTGINGAIDIDSWRCHIWNSASSGSYWVILFGLKKFYVKDDCNSVRIGPLWDRSWTYRKTQLYLPTKLGLWESQLPGYDKHWINPFLSFMGPSLWAHLCGPLIFLNKIFLDLIQN